MERSPMEFLEYVVDRYNINIIHLIFVVFTATIMFFGALMTFMEHLVPETIRQTYRYGKHSFKGEQDPVITFFEIPKSWFKHFYVFALVWSLLGLFLVCYSAVTQQQAPEIIIRLLDLISGGRSRRHAEVSTTTALVTAVFLTMQCVRRFYETHYVQVFSKQGKMNWSHYIVGYCHYFGAVIALLSNTEGFVRNTHPTPVDFTTITLLQRCDILFFSFAFYMQYSCNMILANLRKDPRTGAVKTEKHIMPREGWFNFISCPHMFFEMIMYYGLADLMNPSKSWRFIFCWVVCNQTINAVLTHRWYKENFKEYPKNRKAFLPFLL